MWERLVSPRGFLQLAAASTIAMFLVVTSGAFVRLTASGLGCDHWPRCGTAPFPTQGNEHAIIEFSNRMVALVGIAVALVTWLASRKVHGLSRLGRSSALVSIWEINNELWPARFKHPHVVLTANDRLPHAVCEYDVIEGRAYLTQL